MENISIWNLIGWLGVFLFGMIVFEQTIEEMGKAKLKRILGKNTNTRFKSIVTGIIQTCIFQSSTIVTMMTLWFVGAGVIGLGNALGVVIGANVGTTLTPWIISLLGFKLNIEALALPIIGIGALSVMIFSGYPKIVSIGKFLVWFGFLFLGLGYMKESVEVISHSVSLADYIHLPVWGFVLIGLIMTTIMQTSTGATIITLTALNANIISMDMALGIVIGANMGSAVSTTIVGFLSSTRTQVVKKQVAFSHFLFNISTTLLVTFAYVPLKHLMFLILGDNPDPTIILALFHTTFNVILALLWAPWLKQMIPLLHRLFPRPANSLHLSVERVSTTLPEEILPALQSDTLLLLEKVISYNRASLMLDHSEYRHRIEKYTEIKQIEEKLLESVVVYTTYQYSPEQATSLHLLHDAIIDNISSSKYIKDVSHHLDNLKDNSLEEVMSESYGFFQRLVKQTTDMIHTWEHVSPPLTIEELQDNVANLARSLHSDNDSFIGSLSSTMTHQHNDELNIAEIIKSHHYIILSCEALLQSYLKFYRSQWNHEKNVS